MSALGQKQTSAHLRVMSALPPKADIDRVSCRFRGTASENTHYRKQPKGHWLRMGELMSAFDPKRTSGERVAFDHERLNLTLAKGNFSLAR
jgi:hypothetical protein